MGHNPNLPPVRAKGVVHKQIAATAKGLAAEHWERLSSNNAFHRRWPKVEPYVAHNWRHYIDMTRQVMAAMLGSPKYDEKMKAEISEALLLDATVNPKKMAEPEKRRFFTGPTG